LHLLLSIEHAMPTYDNRPAFSPLAAGVRTIGRDAILLTTLIAAAFGYMFMVVVLVFSLQLIGIL
jgi:hypothetical protein